MQLAWIDLWHFICLFAAGCSMSNVLQAMEVSLILMTTDVDIKAVFVTDL